MKCMYFSVGLDIKENGRANLRITVLKVGRVAIITRGRYAGKKVIPHLPA